MISFLPVAAAAAPKHTGSPGQPTHPRVREAVERTLQIARAAGLTVGTYLNSPEEIAIWQAHRFDFFVYLFDTKILAQAHAQALERMRTLHRAPEASPPRGAV